MQSGPYRSVIALKQQRLDTNGYLSGSPTTAAIYAGTNSGARKGQVEALYEDL